MTTDAVYRIPECARSPHSIGIFDQSTNFAHALAQIVVQVIAGIRAPFDLAISSVIASSNTLHAAKMLVFLSRCSNPNAVFAIPAGTDDIATHSG